MLVVGATGGVGQLVVAKLLAAGYRVRAATRSSARARDVLGASDALEIVEADLRNLPGLRAQRLAAGVDAAVCCVGTTAFPSARWKDNSGPEQTDFVGVRNLVEVVAEEVKEREGSASGKSGSSSSGSSSFARFVLVSSVGVSRTDRMPFLILNLFGVLKYKRMGEEALIASGLPRTILRPGRLTDGPYTSYDVNTVLRATSGSRRSAVLERGDDLLPEETSRIVVADAAVAALRIDEAVDGAFCLGTEEGDGPGADEEKWRELFASA